ncbi:tetratricopeptide repeat protein [Pedobacter sp. SYSU D00535]|uniref:tetratricopeptide repeat protein n=1 Tax=Pedobacter sp. SYSU D00535 TaxID=2810308 RepID=UPI001A9619BE|nr:SEL1-like repeat protein [Pedobacter sp. SYSU D00535]
MPKGGKIAYVVCKLLSIVTAIFVFPLYCYPQVSYTGTLKYNPSQTGIIADVKLSLSYHNSESGLELKQVAQLAAFKGILYEGKLVPLSQLSPPLIKEYGKLPPAITISYDIYNGDTPIRKGITTSGNTKLLWAEVAQGTNNGSTSKAKALQLFFSGALKIKNVSIVSIPFPLEAFRKAAGESVLNKASSPLVAKGAPVNRSQKSVGDILSMISDNETKANQFLLNPALPVVDIQSFSSSLEKQARESKQQKDRIKEELQKQQKFQFGKKFPSDWMSVNELEEVAEKGEPLAIERLARIYILMNTFPKARALYQHLALKKDPHAYRMIAMTYQYEKKFYEAIQYYEKAANQGDTESMKKLGSIYSGYPNLKLSDIPYPLLDSTNFSIINFNYPGVDFDKAVHWYEKAAQLEDTEAMVLLYRLLSGYDEKKYLQSNKSIANFTFKKDILSANKWLQKAKAIGEKESTLATSQSAELLLKEGLQSFERQNYKVAFELLKKSASLRNTEAMVKIGQMLQLGQGTIRNDSQAFTWFQKAALQGNITSYYYLANCYHAGKGVTKNLSKAFEFYELGGRYGIPEALGQLGFMYYQGAGVERNLKRSLKYFIEAREHGFRDAGFYIGNVFRFGGHGIQKDGNQAIHWYKTSIRENEYGGYKFIADTYSSEKSDITDYKKAVENYSLFLEKEKNEDVLRAHKESAIKEIARIYATGGFGIERDPGLSEQWLKKLENN